MGGSKVFSAENEVIVGPADGVTDSALRQEGDERVDLGHLGHVSSVTRRVRHPAVAAVSGHGLGGSAETERAPQQLLHLGGEGLDRAVDLRGRARRS